MNKEIYCYNFDDLGQHILNTIAENRAIDIFLLDDGMLDKTVAEILEHQQHSNQDCSRYSREFMLMNHIDTEEAESIIEQAKTIKWGVEPVIVNACDDNLNMKLSELLKAVN